MPTGYLITTMHLAAAVFCATSNFIGVADSAPDNTIMFTEDGPVVASETINIGELLYAVGFTAEDIYKRHKRGDTQDTPNGAPLPYDPIYCVFGQVYSYIDKTSPACSLQLGGIELPPIEEPSKPNIIYKNKLTGTTIVTERPLDSLKELEKVATIDAVTEFGRSVMSLATGTRLTQQEIDDLGAIYSQLRLVFPAEKKVESVKQGTNPHEVIQTLYTQSYVNRFKDEAAETNASAVVSQVTQYLTGVMPPHEINKNSISKDMVEMGVKKTRRSHGYVYGMKNATHDDIIAAMSEDLNIGKL
jgi:hypothetical protein